MNKLLNLFYSDIIVFHPVTKGLDIVPMSLTYVFSGSFEKPPCLYKI